MDRKEAQRLLKSGKKGIKEWNARRAKGEDIPSLDGLNLEFAHLEGVNLGGINLNHTNLEGAELGDACLQGANLQNAHLEGANLYCACLKEANLYRACLEGADLTGAHLGGARLRMAITNGATTFGGIAIDDKTDMTGVKLGNVLIESRTRAALERNGRQIGWRTRYEENRCLRLHPGILLWVSDYGSSEKRIIWTFLILAYVFAYIYWIPSAMDYQPLIKFLNVDPDGMPLETWPTFWRAIYFSIVTMTTLGFGDMYAHPQSPLGQFLLMFQVILGYILLGALITRFAILFQSVE